MHQHRATPSEWDSPTCETPSSTGVPELDEFASRGWITGVHRRLTSGKEATLYCCHAHPATKRRYVAVKVYREHAARSIRRGQYFEGRERTMKARELRAIRRGSQFGHQVMSGVWMSAEFARLKQLFQAGVTVPEPFATACRGILMEYLGTGDAPAPRLDGVSLDRPSAGRYLEWILEDVETMLSEHVIHGDLSAYNILVWRDRPWIIDLPQAVDARFNRNALELLARDVENVCAHFERLGVETDPQRLALGLWDRYQRASL